jgi:hypothetical protein
LHNCAAGARCHAFGIRNTLALFRIGDPELLDGNLDCAICIRRLDGAEAISAVASNAGDTPARYFGHDRNIGQGLRSGFK